MQRYPRNAAHRARDDSRSETPPLRNPRQTSCPGSAQQVEQHRLDMVVLRVGSTQNITRLENALERGIAGVACQPFSNVPGAVFPRNNVKHRNFDRQTTTDLDALTRPPRRFRVQMMIDMDGVQRQFGLALPRPRKRMEQRERVRAAAEGDHEPALRRIRSRKPGDYFRSEHPGIESVHVKTVNPAQ